MGEPPNTPRSPAAATPSDNGRPAPTSFGSLDVSPPVGSALAAMGYEAPTPIQELVIPIARADRDLVGQAQTGTGKTAAFGIPLVEAVDPGARHIQALVLAPTRELAVQVSKELSRLAEFSGIRSVAIYGGQAMSRQLTALSEGVQIVVATPGRLMDHMQRRTIDIGRVRHVVLDEADQMLDIGFAPDIHYILRRTPESRQTPPLLRHHARPHPRPRPPVSQQPRVAPGGRRR